MFDQKKIADEADVIIDGYAFIKKKDNRITIDILIKSFQQT